MRTLIGFIAGIAAAYTALAIWQRLPGLPDIDPDWSPTEQDIQQHLAAAARRRLP